MYHRKGKHNELLGSALARSFSVVKRLKSAPVDLAKYSELDLDLIQSEPDMMEVWSAMHMKAELNTHPDLIRQLTGVAETELDLYLKRCKELASEPKSARILRPHIFKKASEKYVVSRMLRKEGNKKICDEGCLCIVVSIRRSKAKIFGFIFEESGQK